MKLLTFTGFRGVAGMFQVGEIRFVLVAANAEQLETLYNGLLKDAGPFNPDACKKSIVISSSILPEPKTTNEQNDTRQSPQA